MKFQALQSKREAIAGKVIVGIDPAKNKHQVAILDPQGVQLSNSFGFDVSCEGYTDHLWKKVTKILPTCNPHSVIFAVETSCNLWQTIAFYLHQQGYSVLLVSPLTTYHTRPMISHEFSRTDPKDALLVASNAQHGSVFSPELSLPA
jgi:transposase